MRISISVVNVSTFNFVSAPCPILYSFLRYHVLLNEILRVIILLEQFVTIPFSEVPFKQINYTSSIIPKSTFKTLFLFNKVIVNLLHLLLLYLVFNLLLHFRSIFCLWISVWRIPFEHTFAFQLWSWNGKLAFRCWSIAEDFILSFIFFLDESKVFIKV